MIKRRTILDDMTDTERKRVRIMALFEYFPDALVEVALVIAEGQNQHGTAEWDKTKSNDHHGSLLRHMLQAGAVDKDGRRHSGKVAWRALAALQMEFDRERAESDRAANPRPRAKRSRTVTPVPKRGGLRRTRRG